jgi:transposase
MRERARQLEADIQRRIDADELGKLFTTIQGISTLSAAAIIAETAIPLGFRTPPHPPVTSLSAIKMLS